jgi:hypothetical protein
VVRRLTVGSCGAVLVLGLLVAGCTPDPGRTPTVTPVPSVTSATPSPTPTENAQERQQRLDFEAAEKAYLTAFAESGRLAVAGGVNKPTKVMLANTDGFYLDVQLNDLKVLKKNGWHADRPSTTTVMSDGGWSPDELGLTACEDGSKLRLLDQQGKEVAKDRPMRFVQTLTATRSDGRWKITDVESKAVEDFASVSGCAK